MTTTEEAHGLRDMRMAVETGIGHMGVWERIGMELTAVDPGTAEVTLTVTDGLSNLGGSVHGGIVATVLDAALACAVHTELPANSGVATIDLTVSYVRPASLSNSTLRGIGKVVRVGKRVAQATGEVLDDQGNIVATALGSFSIMTVNYDA